VIAGVGAIISLIGAIFAHHAAAVKRDLNFGCSAIPAVNNAFSVIRQAVASGQMKASDAAAALPQIYSQYMSAGGAGGSVSSGPSGIPGGGQPINDSPWCNSNCELSVVLLAMILFWQAQFQAMAAASSQAALPAAPAPVPSQAIPAQPTVTTPAPRPTLAPAVPTSALVLRPPTAAASTSTPGWVFLAAAAVMRHQKIRAQRQRTHNFLMEGLHGTSAQHGIRRREIDQVIVVDYDGAKRKFFAPRAKSLRICFGNSRWATRPHPRA
jgi:hypothetical protein